MVLLRIFYARTLTTCYTRVTDICESGADCLQQMDLMTFSDSSQACYYYVRILSDLTNVMPTTSDDALTVS